MIWDPHESPVDCWLLLWSFKVPQGQSLIEAFWFNLSTYFILRSLSSCQFSPSGSQVVTISTDDKFRLYNTENITGSALQPAAQVIGDHVEKRPSQAWSRPSLENCPFWYCLWWREIRRTLYCFKASDFSILMSNLVSLVRSETHDCYHHPHPNPGAA